MRVAATETLFTSPSWFPDRIDWKNGLIRLLPVAKPVLIDTAFLDGRTPLANPALARVMSLTDFVEGMAGATCDARLILHESFCGSTLLAHALTIEGQVLTMREPQILVDLADYRPSAAAADLPLYRAVLRAAVAKLSQRWPDGAPVVIKPSNWANTIAADLLEVSCPRRAVFVHVDPAAFLIAVIRGGRDRLRYVLGLRAHLLQALPDLAIPLSPDPVPGRDPLTEAMEQVMQAFWMQRRLLAAAATDVPSTALEFPDWLSDPVRAVERAQAALGLELSHDQVERSVTARLPNYSKSDHPTRFDANAEAAANARVRRDYAAVIESSLQALARYEQIGLWRDRPQAIDAA